MEKSRLVQLLRTLSPAELRELGKFLRSPFFNRRTDVVQFFDLLAKVLKTGRAFPSKEEAFTKLFPGEPFDDHRMRMLMSMLFQLTGQYLAIGDFWTDELRFGRRLAAVYRKRRLDGHFAQAWNDLSEKHERQPLRNADFYQEDYLIRLEKYRSVFDTQQVNGEELQALSDSLDTAFLTRKLWQACFMLSHRAVSGASYNFGLLDTALAYAEKSALDTPAVAIYYYCYLALTNPSEKSFFQKFKGLMLKHGDLFPTEELRDLSILAINFCIRQYNAGNPEYLRDQFDFYKEGFKKGYFLVDGTLSRYTYQNAVTSGLVLEEFGWAEKFIHDYREKLAQPYRESVFSFNLARLEYQRRNHGAALQLLQKAEYKDLLLNLAAKTLQLKIFYELDEFDLLEAHLKAFRAFLNRKKGMGYHRENYLNTILLTQKLLEVNPFDKTARGILRKEIEGTKSLAEKEWLLEQV